MYLFEQCCRVTDEMEKGLIGVQGLVENHRFEGFFLFVRSDIQLKVGCFFIVFLFLSKFKQWPLCPLSAFL